ncbi:hypothetical protein DFH08DRAFT_865805 [Mycena albidolilacea]|uniref:Uncharacterized protein n=1 Tax=Mycena albidolilacea TaxID=1033008 RepID=A0AAD7A2M7_9AGAR|nr:hypothetical protein DFH08DRAFT_865805 [Mycena albidolilacea]
MLTQRAESLAAMPEPRGIGFCGYLPGGKNCVIALLRHARLRSCDVWKCLKDSNAFTCECLGTLGSASLTVTAIFLGIRVFGSSRRMPARQLPSRSCQPTLTPNILQQIAAHNPPLALQIITPSNHLGLFDSNSRRRSFFSLQLEAYPPLFCIRGL